MNQFDEMKMKKTFHVHVDMETGRFQMNPQPSCWEAIVSNFFFSAPGVQGLPGG